MNNAPEDSPEFHDTRLLILAKRLSDCQGRLETVERERDEMIEIVGKPAKAWFDAARTAESRVGELEVFVREVQNHRDHKATDFCVPLLIECADALL